MLLKIVEVFNMVVKNCFIGISKNSPLYCVPLELKGSKWYIKYFVGSESYEAFLMPNIDLSYYVGRPIRIAILNGKYSIQIL